jgi:carboxypeptidase C (cathepsin A)
MVLLLLCGLLVVAAATMASAAPFAVRSLPGWQGPLPDKMSTGYLPVGDAWGSRLFYWLAEARNPAPNPADTPVVLWLQGGPGCSGGVGWFLENGPFNLASNGSLAFNDFSWNNQAHYLFVDQPVGTGLSTLPPKATNATYATTIEQSTNQLYKAIKYFFAKEMPHMAKNPFYITGESYAYVSSFGNRASCGKDLCYTVHPESTSSSFLT